MRVLIVEDEPDMAQVLKESTLTSQRLAPSHKGKRPKSEVI
jgi:DNA-binding response OmpR family regulator